MKTEKAIKMLNLLSEKIPSLYETRPPHTSVLMDNVAFDSYHLLRNTEAMVIMSTVLEDPEKNIKVPNLSITIDTGRNRLGPHLEEVFSVYIGQDIDIINLATRIDRILKKYQQ